MTKLKHSTLVFAALTLFAAAANADPCLTNPSATVGDPTFNATVQTFINAGINPNTTCIENGLWTDPANFGLGTYVKGAEAAGFSTNPTSFNSAYAGDPTSMIPFDANARDFRWVQDISPNAAPGGAVGSAPSQGIIWDLGGPANQAAVFVFVDHGPVPGEALENTVWLSNDPNAPNAGWTQAQLVHVYGAGWSPGPNIADGFAAVYQLPSAQTFRYVSVTWGGPGAIQRDGDNEIDAVGGLTAQGTGVAAVPEPSSFALFGSLLAGAGVVYRRRLKIRA